MDEFNGEDRKLLHNLDTRMAVVESKVAYISRAISFVALTMVGGFLAGVLNVVMK